MNRDDKITLAHGNGGSLSHRLIRDVFKSEFQSPGNSQDYSDGATLPVVNGRIVMSTDSFVVSPIFFPGGDLGSLAVNGTVNDLAVCGARPLYLSVGFIIEEGFALSDLKKIARSMAAEAKKAGVSIVTGDTKVVERGACDGIYVNTAGIGELRDDAPSGVDFIKDGDAVIVSGSMGDHGMSLYALREGIGLRSSLESDCASVYPLVDLLLSNAISVRIMRDPTRGGLATTLNEFVSGSSLGIILDEESIPVKNEVKGLCELLGFDPLHVANEGKLVVIVDSDHKEKAVQLIRSHEVGSDAAVIGEISSRYPGRVSLVTEVGGERIVDMLMGDMLPRIC